MNKDSQENCIDVQMPKRRDGLIERELPDELILYDPETDRVFLLNHTSAAIWDLCDGVNCVRLIADRIASLFSGRVEQVYEDVRRIVSEYAETGLLKSFDGRACTQRDMPGARPESVL